jgi:UPF0755 protein
MNSRSGKRLLSLIVAVAVAVVFGSIFFLIKGSGLPADYPTGTAGKDVVVEVPSGATGSEIAKLLVANGVVKSYAAFFQVAVIDNRSTQIAPGAHRLQQMIPAKVALNQLLDNTRIPNLLKVTEGEWTDEILAQLIAQGFSKNDLRSALSKLTLPAGFSGTEGIFFPAQYSFVHGTSALKALQNMVDRFGYEAKAWGLSQGVKGFSPMQLLTIASLIQSEGDVSDFAKISQVIQNRLKIGMQLQLDTTVQYITRTRGQVYLSAEATKIASPYNTYQHFGLPPGPICNPGRAAMDAALHPETGNWTYFITVKPGDTRFTASSAQFLTWKSLYQKNLMAGVFGKKK